MNRRIAISVALLAAVGMLTCTGCGPARPELAPVSGRVTYQGKPLPVGRITFYPERGRPASGAIGADGTYRLTTFKTDDGALPGNYRVTITATRTVGGARPKSIDEEMKMMSGGKTPAVELLVPSKYSSRESTPLTAEVKPGENSIDFEL